MNTEPKNPTRTRRTGRSLTVLTWVVVLIGLIYAEEDWRGWHAWRQFKKEWEAKGEKFDRQSVVPPPVPDGQNFALTPLVFTSYGWLLTRDGKMIPTEKRDTNFVNRTQMSIAADDSLLDWRTNSTGNWETTETANLAAWQEYYRALAAKTNLFPISSQTQTPAQDVLLALSKYDSTIEELREAGKLPFSRFPLEYDKDRPYNIFLPHLASLKSCAQVLQLRSIAELQNGQGEKALSDVKLMPRLSDSIRTEPFLISHLVRISIVNLAVQSIYEGLAGHKWSDAQLMELDAALAREDFLADYQLAMRGEMNLCEGGSLEFFRHHPGYLTTMDTEGSSPTLSAKILGYLIPDGVFYQNQLRCARPMVEMYLPMADVKNQTVSPESVRLANAAVRAETKHFTPYNLFERMFLPELVKTVTRFAQSQNTVDLARIAMALDRYWLAHGEYPKTLDVLTPSFLTSLPHDVIDGGPLKYRREADGSFVLYSVGWNEVDDGGAVVLRKGSTSRVDLEKGDWVWRYPQK